ncbi:hypothetical protein KKC88_05130 [Patescibacteria group bacterium]|nr:hypothetical protein [Patescibacteria group bacterium]MBU1673710.1 hypothetical protein [Patescibacteria group bacterium]MBU1963060.1 hypothetical protein [Patescibacteria group bacterium]
MSDQNTQTPSILDKVIESKEESEKSEFNPQELISLLLRKLTSKEADVLKRRFGLNEHDKQTLEAIGNYYNVTRERIRQIENLSIKKIKEASDFQDLVKNAEHVITTILSQNGGVCEQNFLMKEVFMTSHTPANERAILFILSELLGDRFEKVPNSKRYRLSWKMKLTQIDFLDKVIEVVKGELNNDEKPQSLERIFELFMTTDFYNQYKEQITEDVLGSFMEVSQAIARNPFDEYGLSSWGSVVPKRMNDKIYLILKKEGKPMHFVDIAGRITEVFKKKAYPPTVHNELILNKEYVLVGRGIYALTEWGYKRGVVADVITEVLEKASEPLTRNEIVKRVLDQRIVKKNTIHLALTNKKKFNKLSDGRYAIAEQEVKPAEAPISDTEEDK